jgi:hypothetical protein
MKPVVEAATRDTGQLDAGEVARQSLGWMPRGQLLAMEAAPGRPRRAHTNSVVQSPHPQQGPISPLSY